MAWEKKYTFTLYMQNNFTISIFDILETSKLYAIWTLISETKMVKFSLILHLVTAY